MIIFFILFNYYYSTIITFNFDFYRFLFVEYLFQFAIIKLKIFVVNFAFLFHYSIIFSQHLTY